MRAIHGPPVLCYCRLSVVHLNLLAFSLMNKGTIKLPIARLPIADCRFEDRSDVRGNGDHKNLGVPNSELGTGNWELELPEKSIHSSEYTIYLSTIMNCAPPSAV